METITYKGYKIDIDYQDYTESPREWGNLGTMICTHSDYNLGDTSCDNVEDFFYELYVLAECTFYVEHSYGDCSERIMKELEKVALVMPLYLYDHSGITINTTGFSCSWDSGIVGYIVALKKDIYREYNCKRVSKRIKALVETVLISEVDIYDSYIKGSVYQYSVEKGDEDIDSCCGFYGDDLDNNGLLDYAKNAIDSDIASKKLQRFKTLKAMIKGKTPLHKRAELLPLYTF